MAECFSLLNVMCFISDKNICLAEENAQVLQKRGFNNSTLPSQNLGKVPLNPSFPLRSPEYLPSSNAPTAVRTDEPSKGEVDARGIVEERGRLGLGLGFI